MRSALARASQRSAALPASRLFGAKAPVNGFSMNTCLPASTAWRVTGSWGAGGEDTSTTSTWGNIAGGAGEGGVAGLARESSRPLRGGGGHGGEAGLDTVHAAIGEQMQVGGEPRADDADPQRGHVVPLGGGARP